MGGVAGPESRKENKPVGEAKKKKWRVVTMD
jgi:hypothetical protein